MSTLAMLVDLARSASRDPDRDALRTRLVYNGAAVLGERVESAPIVRGLVQDSGPGPFAYALAAKMHARTQDDFHPAGRVHVGTVVIPAILAVDAVDDPFASLAAGYEVLAAVASAYSDIAQLRGYRPTGIFGPLGAAAAAGVALGLDDPQLRSALALASTMSAGTNQSWIDGSDEWLVEVAAASRAGVDAARLAAAGVRGAPNALDGPAGWSRALFDDEGSSRLEAALAGGRPQTEHVAIKPYPVSGIAQVPTKLSAGLGVDWDHVHPDRVEVRMTPRELGYPGSRNRGPFRSRSDSLMSVTRCVALAYLHQSVPYRLLLKPPGSEEAALIDRIELVADESLDETEAVVAVTVGDRTRSEHGRGSELLYPDWATTQQTLEVIARLFEAPLGAIRGLHSAVEGEVDVATVRDLFRERS